MSEERTEAATPKRRKKAREEGRVARSAELVGCAILLAVLWALPRLLPDLGSQASGYFVGAFTTAGRGGISPDGLGQIALGSLGQVGRLAGPVLGLVVLAALASNVAQVGFHFTPAPLQPKLSRMDPLQGLRRMVAARSAVELLKAAAKVAIVCVSGCRYCSGRRESLLLLSASDPSRIAPRVGELAYGMAMQMVSTLAVLAALDYAYQRWQFERTLRMTKQEVRDELKETEVNPEIRARIRQRRREIARRRMMAEVPLAAVIITNPTHYAIALKYEQGQQGAPKVVAKGRDLIALRIREIAAEHRVPVVENPPLARSIYTMVEIDEEIPAELYRAVAEVISLVWRTEKGVIRNA